MITRPPLELKKYFFPFVQVAADAEFQPGEDEIVPHFDVRTSVARNDSDSLFQVSVEIVTEPVNEKMHIPYSIHLIGVGLFAVDDTWPDPEKLLKITGASIIYSASREFIITVTSRGPWPPVILPTISFAESDNHEKQV